MFSSTYLRTAVGIASLLAVPVHAGCISKKVDAADGPSLAALHTFIAEQVPARMWGQVKGIYERKRRRAKTTVSLEVCTAQTRVTADAQPPIVLRHYTTRDNPLMEEIRRDPALSRTIDFWKRVEQMSSKEGIIYALLDENIILSRHRFMDSLSKDSVQDSLYAQLMRWRALNDSLQERACPQGPLPPLSGAASAYDTLLFFYHRRAEKQSLEEACAFFGQDRVLRYRTGAKEKHDTILAQKTGYLIRARVLFEQKGLPSWLAYLAVAESYLNPHATSHSGAVGAWQFMKASARERGLIVRKKFDERRDPLFSKLAGLSFLNDARTRLGSLPYAILSYNQGDQPLLDAIDELRTNNLVQLLHQFRTDRLKPKEERVLSRRYDAGYTYLLRFLAIAELYDAWLQDTAAPRDAQPEFSYLFLLQDASRHTFSRQLGIRDSLLAYWNPALIGDSIPASAPIRIPQHRFPDVLDAYLLTLSQQTYLRHGVKQGESLWSLSRQYGVPIFDLKEANGLSSSRIRYGQDLRIPAQRTYASHETDSLHARLLDLDAHMCKWVRTGEIDTTIIEGHCDPLLSYLARKMARAPKNLSSTPVSVSATATSAFEGYAPEPKGQAPRFFREPVLHRLKGGYGKSNLFF